MVLRFPAPPIAPALVLIVLLVLTACSTAESSPATAEDAVRRQFVGNWELVSYVSFNAEGQETDMNYIGRITYDDRGNMSAVGMPRDLPDRPRVQGEPTPRAGFAYFARVSVDVADERVTHHVVGSPMNPAWVGTDLIRYYEFSEDRLALSIRNDAGRVTGTLTWQRLD
jgi:hypothetical protein